MVCPPPAVFWLLFLPPVWLTPLHLLPGEARAIVNVDMSMPCLKSFQDKLKSGSLAQDSFWAGSFLPPRVHLSLCTPSCTPNDLQFSKRSTLLHRPVPLHTIVSLLWDPSPPSDFTWPPLVFQALVHTSAPLSLRLSRCPWGLSWYLCTLLSSRLWPYIEKFTGLLVSTTWL